MALHYTNMGVGHQVNGIYSDLFTMNKAGVDETLEDEGITADSAQDSLDGTSDEESDPESDHSSDEEVEDERLESSEESEGDYESD